MGKASVNGFAKPYSPRLGTSVALRRVLRTKLLAVRKRTCLATVHLFSELVGIQLLLINTLGPLIRGERMTADHLKAILRQVQSTKGRKAQELLAKRLNAEERIG